MGIRIPGRMTPHTVRVRDFLGESSTGTLRGPERTVERCQYTGTSEDVVGPDGKTYRQVGRLIVRGQYGPVPVGSLVTPPDGGTPLRVLTAAPYTGFPGVEGFYDLALVVDRRG